MSPGVGPLDVRFVQVSIPTGKREAVLRTLEEEGIDYVVVDETSGRNYTAIVLFPLPINAVEPLLNKLKDVGIDDEAHTVILDAETVVSRKFDRLQKRYQNEEEEVTTETRIAGDELRTRAEELAPTFTTYVVLTAVSAVVATAGLLLDSPATVVGSMVIAPLIGPAMAASVGTVVNNRGLFLRGAKLQALGLGLAVASAAVFAAFVKYLHLVPPGLQLTTLGEITERVAPGILTLAVALGAGIAGAISLSAGVSTAIVGVMIAVALIPPAAVVGIGIAWGQWVMALGAGVLTLVNTLSINLSAIGTLWYRGYHPRRLFKRDAARSVVMKRGAVLVGAIAVLSLFLGGVTYDSYRDAQDEREIQNNVQKVVEGKEDLTLLGINIERDRGSFFQPPDRVVVNVGTRPGTNPPSIAEDLKQNIDQVTGGDVTIQVRYVTIETAS